MSTFQDWTLSVGLTEQLARLCAGQRERHKDNPRSMPPPQPYPRVFTQHVAVNMEQAAEPAGESHKRCKE